MFWVIFLIGLGVIGVFALAATGSFGELKNDESLETKSEYVAGQRIPFTLFGYKKSRVDEVISQLQFEIESLKKGKK